MPGSLSNHFHCDMLVIVRDESKTGVTWPKSKGRSQVLYQADQIHRQRLPKSASSGVSCYSKVETDLILMHDNLLVIIFFDVYMRYSLESSGVVLLVCVGLGNVDGSLLNGRLMIDLLRIRGTLVH